MTTTKRWIAILGVLAVAALAAGIIRLTPVHMGRQPDGSFLVSTGQRIEAGSIAFNGRPIDLALHPRGEVFAVLNKSEVFLATTAGVRAGPNRDRHNQTDHHSIGKTIQQEISERDNRRGE